MKNRSKIIITIMLLLFCRFAVTQSQVTVKLGFLFEQISLPSFKKYGGNPGYGFNLGIGYNYTIKSKIDLAQTLDFYFFTHNKYGSSFVLTSMFDFRYKPGKFNIDFQIGPGYILFNNFSPVYKQVNGKYEKESNFQNKFAAMTSIGVSYNIQKFKPFISYNLLAEIPFITSSSGFLPHQIFEVGCYYNLILKKNEK